MTGGAHDNDKVMRRGDEHFAPEAAIAEAELVTMPGKPSALPGWWDRLAPYLAVSLGGALGANLRYLVGLWAAARWSGAFPWGTLLINLTGSLLLGGLLTLLAARRPEPRLLRLFLATGLLGAYTTFSTFSAETVALAASRPLALALAYVILSVGGGYGAAQIGVACVHWRVREAMVADR